MIQIIKAKNSHVEGISNVCIKAYWARYGETHSKEWIKKVLGAAGGGMIDELVGELFLIYIDPDRRNEGIGTELLNAVTKQQKEE